MTAEAGGQQQKIRNASLDVIRTIAILLVVINHAVEAAYPLHKISAMASLGTGTLAFGYTAFTLGRLGVPLFLMLTGYLLLSRDFFQTKNGVASFYKKNLLPLLLTWEIWVLLYNIIACVSSGRSFSLPSYLLQAVFLKSVPFAHGWYVPAILGIYLFIPFVAKILSLMRGRWIVLLMGITWAYLFLFSTLGLGGSNDSVTLELSFSGGMCGLYLVLGYCLFRYEGKLDQLSKRGRNLAILTAAAALLFFCTAFFHFYMLNKGQEYYIWYSFFTLPFVGAAAFLLLKRIHPSSFMQKIFLEISVCSFGIYLIHKPLVNLLNRYLPEFHPIAEVICFTIITFLVSFALVSLLGRIGKGRVGKVLFLRKKTQKVIQK